MTVDIRDLTLANPAPVLVRDYRPRKPSELPPMLWVHGGGFAGGSIDMPESDAVARRLAGMGQVVRTVEYRLAPPIPDAGPFAPDESETRYPAAQDDVVRAFFDLVPDGSAFLGGASAGACIAASAATRLRDEQRPQPLGLVLVYGLFHARFPLHKDAEGEQLRTLTDASADEWLTRMNTNYVGAVDGLADPRAFPGEGDPAGLPATLILDAQRDSLRASGKRFAQQLIHAGVPTTEIVVSDAEHGFLNDPGSRYFMRGTAEMHHWMRSYPL